MDRRTRTRTLVVGAVIMALAVGAAGVYWMPGSTDEAPPSAQERHADRSPGFLDRAVESGITFKMSFLPTEQGERFKFNLYDHGCGVAVGDYDGDGHDDVYFLNQLGANALFRNRGDGTFTDVTDEAGVALADRICVGATFADYDNDGRQDLYVTSTRGGNVLFRNTGDGRFEDVTEKAGLTLVAHSQTASFFDYNKDGLLDLFVTNTAQWTLNEIDDKLAYYPGVENIGQLATAPKEYNVFYRNNGDGTFTDVTEAAGLHGQSWGGDVAVFDHDDDSHLDLLVTNMFGASRLYRNDGAGAFHEVTAVTLQRTPWGAIGAKAFDYNNDGRLDLLIVDMHSDMWGRATDDPDALALAHKYANVKHGGVTGPFSVFGPRRLLSEAERVPAKMFQVRYDAVFFGNGLYKNLGGGKFDEVSQRAGLETFWPWGIATGDFDGDGFVDVFLPAGMGHPYFYWPCSLMMNNGDETFTDRAEQEGVEPPAAGRFLAEKIGPYQGARSSRCAATADFDGDGRLDLITNNFNDRPYYFRNQFPHADYIAFELQGTSSNRDAIGAEVALVCGAEKLTRQVHAAGGYLSQSSRRLHFGLGKRGEVSHAEIRWPSGVVQRIDAPEINRLHKLIEPARDIRDPRS